MKEVLRPERVIVLVMGYDIPHAHVHLMPSNSGQDFYNAIGRIKETSDTLANESDLKRNAERLKQ